MKKIIKYKELFTKEERKCFDELCVVTAYLLSAKPNKKRLERSIKDAKNGKLTEHELIK